MAQVRKFSSSYVVTDIELSVDGQTVKGSALATGGYGRYFTAQVESPEVLDGPVRKHLEALIEAAAEYESTVFDARQKFQERAEALTTAFKRGAAEPVSTPAEEPAPESTAATATDDSI